MIKINLLGEEVKDGGNNIWWLVGFGATAIVLVVGFALAYLSLGSAIEEQKSQTQLLEAKLENLKKTTKEVRELEVKRKELRDKLAVIATLKLNKTGPVRVMDDLNQALPERAWLKGVTEKEKVMTIQGLALDNPTISAFMKAMEGSPYFRDINLVASKQADWQGSKIKQFDLQTKVNYAGKYAPPASPSPGPLVSLPTAPVKSGR